MVSFLPSPNKLEGCWNKIIGKILGEREKVSVPKIEDRIPVSKKERAVASLESANVFA